MTPARVAPFFVVGALALGACASEEGIVEVYWEIENAELERIFPQGLRSDSCGFESESGIRFDLEVQLTIAENSTACAEGWDTSDCAVIEQLSFDCARSRGTATAVPISASGDEDPGYLMFAELTMNPTDSAAFVPIAACMAGPGPRVRRVLPGRITDLEVYQFVFHALDPGKQGLVDIDLCRGDDEADSIDTGSTDSETSG
ncbi:hypothetical protein G6O69_17330 [Pseudenhygromyxa sp. WMMC2535]|uniref:hypothetical protein n=1 Tax=Pseudenhygromyxa sp. WMMC2535 TaxID=2712867 RepID=UPI0015526866|nr:hypothetical protein [Pseudenhygromyxa sp. WMMC2535]NVB39608.1 hypothetical protein [Pseudenhygromyxa sp. WMMC2535]